MPTSDRAGLLTVAGDGFLRGDSPHQILSGAIHYFRIHPDLWHDRLLRMRAMGLNTVETYVAWNVHERTRGRFDFTGGADLARFVELAGGLGLDVIVRPGPYVCAEWDFGGLPAWLMADPDMRLRCDDPPFMQAVADWFAVLLPELVPLLRTNGGPVVAVQIENEYGSYGEDPAYLAAVRDLLVDGGIDVLLFTSDGPTPDRLAAGSVPGILATANFGSRVASAFGELQRAQPQGPVMCMEYWNGWFDHWGDPHHVRDPEDAAATLDEMLAVGGSVNLYMAHGGTNFGLRNGANIEGREFQPTVTSYDYDAAIGEAGELTPKFALFREVFGRYAAGPLPQPPPLPARLAPQSVPVTRWARLFDGIDDLGEPRQAAAPLTMEELGQDNGLVLYRREVTLHQEGEELVLEGLRDRAQVFVDGREIGTINRNDAIHAVALPDDLPRDRPLALDVLVENQGRVNFGPHQGERKGVRDIRLGQRHLHGWNSLPLPLDEPGFAERLTPRLGWATSVGEGHGPVLAAVSIDIEAPADGFLACPGWTKGFLWLNGVLLGRYWDLGPQVTLYAPAPLWRAGSNEILVLELHEPGDTIDLRDTSDLGPEGRAPDIE